MCMIGKPVKLVTLSRARGLIGFRAWSKPSRRDELLSLFRDFVWFPRTVTRARGKIALHGSKGLWAYNSRSTRNRRVPRPSSFPAVYGKIRGWGVVALHAHGFRSQYAEILHTDTQ